MVCDAVIVGLTYLHTGSELVHRGRTSLTLTGTPPLATSGFGADPFGTSNFGG